jgi:hypothetical protein
LMQAAQRQRKCVVEFMVGNVAFPVTGTSSGGERRGCLEEVFVGACVKVQQIWVNSVCVV